MQDRDSPAGAIDDDPGAPLRPVLAQRVGVVGLGLIGGSVALATRRAMPGVHLVGVDRAEILDIAQERSIVDEGFALERAADALAACDLVVLALPVRLIEAQLAVLAPALREGPVVTDTGSTKAAIAATAHRLQLVHFVGSHPMAGKASSGLAHAEASLFDDATWFICPSPSTSHEATGAVRQWVRALGARAVEIDAEEHDRAVAVTSHLPHLLINALAEVVLDESVIDAAGGSLREVFGIAGAPVDTWADILATNDEAVRAAVRDFSARLEDIADRLDDRDRLRELFAAGRACKERLVR